MFQETFKYYKSRCPPPSYESILDFNNVDEKFTVKKLSNNGTEDFKHVGLSNPMKWQTYQLPSGLIYIKNPFTPQGQRYWIARCLRDYPKSPHANNLRSHKSLSSSVKNDWWAEMSSALLTEKERLRTAMRWCTLGYHHDWDTKVYTEEMKHSFPSDLANMSAYIADILGLGKYSAEAAIVNYYPIGTTLAGHTDHSERDLEAPLFSYSFGQTAIFLIGGKTKDIKPTAMFLRSGDIVVMTRESRLCYHGVPKVFKSDYSPWIFIDDVKDDEMKHSTPKRRRVNIDSELDILELWNSVEDKHFWKPFDEYLQKCRININVRQVLREGENSL